MPNLKAPLCKSWGSGLLFRCLRFLRFEQSKAKGSSWEIIRTSTVQLLQTPSLKTTKRINKKLWKKIKQQQNHAKTRFCLIWSAVAIVGIVAKVLLPPVGFMLAPIYFWMLMLQLRECRLHWRPFWRLRFCRSLWMALIAIAWIARISIISLISLVGLGMATWSIALTSWLRKWCSWTWSCTRWRTHVLNGHTRLGLGDI